MPRIRQLAEKYAAEDAEKAKENFMEELDHQKYLNGYRSDRNLADTLGISAPSIGRYRKNPGTMQIETMQKFVALLKPDISVVLRLLGYSEKEIRAFAKQNAT